MIFNPTTLPAIQKSIVQKTTDFSTTSNVFTNVTDLTITFTTGARRVLLSLTASIFNAGTINNYLTFAVDETNVAGANGLLQESGTSQNIRVTRHIHFITNILTATSHTFKVQLRNSDNLTTVYIFGLPDCIFTAIELI